MKPFAADRRHFSFVSFRIPELWRRSSSFPNMTLKVTLPQLLRRRYTAVKWSTKAHFNMGLRSVAYSDYIRVGWPGTDLSLARIFLFAGVHPAAFFVGFSLAGNKALGMGNRTLRYRLCSAKANVWNSSSTPPYALVAWRSDTGITKYIVPCVIIVCVRTTRRRESTESYL